MEISHEEFNAVIREKKEYERIKEKTMKNKNASEKQENMRLNSVNSRKVTSL